MRKEGDIKLTNNKEVLKHDLLILLTFFTFITLINLVYSQFTNIRKLSYFNTFNIQEFLNLTFI